MSISPQTATAIIEGLARLGFDFTSPKGPPRLAEDEDLARLWWRAIQQANRRTVPMEVGLTLPLGAMEIVDYLAASSATVGAALTVTQQVFPLVGPGVQLHFEQGRQGTRVVTVENHPPYPGQIESDGFVVGVLWGRLRQLAREPLEPLLIELTEPWEHKAWAQLLQVPKVRFGARHARIHLRARAWSTPLQSADPRLLKTLQKMVGLQHRAPDALLTAVRALANQRFPELLDLDQAATALGLSRRTLQRKLAESQTSLSEQVDKTRKDRAEELLSDQLLSIGEVAQRLGFAEAASFTRACRRWFGKAPSEWRTGAGLALDATGSESPRPPRS